MINSIELLYNDQNEYIGFVGLIRVKDQDIFVDTRTGKGYDRVLSLLSDMVGYLASKFNLESFTIEDNRQHVILRMLEGIPKFNPNRDTKLSSFLQMRVSRRLINKVRDANRFHNNATLLNIKAYSYRCSCGNTIKAAREDKLDSCNACGLPIDKTKLHWIRKATISLNGLSDGYLSLYPQESDAGKRMAELDLMSCIENESPQIKEIVCLLYFEGHTVKAISEKLGLSASSIYVKLKGLQRNHKLSELIRRDDVCIG